MTDYTIREYRSGDIPQLRALWHEAFGDPDSLTEAFFKWLPDMGTAMVCVCGDRLLGAAYVIAGLELADCGKKPPVCGYIYAVAVDRPHRSQGLGAALVKAAAEKARQREAELICTLPAEPSLYGWYNKLLGTKCALYRQRYEVESAALEPVMALSSTEYMLWRETMLRGRPHLRPSNPTLEFARLFYESLGGGLYACGSGICAAYKEGHSAVIRELVSMDEAECASIAASVGAFLGAERSEYWLPAKAGEPYIAAVPGIIPADCVWNLSFD